MNAQGCFRLILLATILGCVQPGRSADAPSFEAEANPVEPGLIQRSRALALTLAMQESNRLRISIPGAVTTDVELAPSAEPLEAPLPPARPSIFEGREEYVRITLALMLVTTLALRARARHRQDAAVRALCGGYLSDGTEVAKFKMPEWFAPKPAPLPQPECALNVVNISSAEITMPTPLAQFFQQAPGRLARILEVLKELGSPVAPEERQKTLLKACELVCELKEKADCWDLRPAWQMSSTLELLLKRVADKPKDCTPSVVRTIATAVDMLRQVCVPGVRPNLLIDPPLKILAVDDDQLCRRALKFALEKANLVPDLAETGEQAVELATAHAYDVVFMDIQMPGIDGLTACSQIHETKKNPDVPVIFVTVQSDFNTRAESRLKGGADLMAKPYLVLELTVRAVTFAMRKRLQDLGSSRQETTVGSPIVVASTLPRTVAPVAPAPTETESRQPTTGASSARAEKTFTTTPQTSCPTIDQIPADVADLNGDFFTEAPGYLATTREVFEELRADMEPAAMLEPMGSLYLRVHAIATKAGLDKLPVTGHVSSTLEALLKRLHRNPKTVTASTLNTVSSALKLLESLCVRGVEEKLGGHPALRILVVDDEPLARRAVVGALQLAFKQPESAPDGAKASRMVAETAYDVIFTDVQMPGLDGFELCSAIRASALNGQTPVVFVTNNTDVEAQARAVACGGNDFIGKPFLPIEITVKALTFAWEDRLRKINSAPTTTAPATRHSAEPPPAPVSPILQTVPPTTTETAEVPPAAQPATQTSVVATEQRAVTPIGADELAGDFFSEITPFLKATQELIERLQSISAPSAPLFLQAQLDVLYLRMHTLAARAERDSLLVASHIASTLEALLKRLQRNPKTVTASTLNTVLNALRLLESVCRPGVEEKLAGHAPIRILVADDEPLARRAVVGALQLAFKQPESASDGTKASRMAAETAYDVIFTDVQMPGLDGFELCADIRAGTLNGRTPVVFVTNNTDVEAQARAVACGANDFIGKPFLPIEITVKALTFAWESRLRKVHSAAPSPSRGNRSDQATALIAA